jgi:hypothetical protein
MIVGARNSHKGRTELRGSGQVQRVARMGAAEYDDRPGHDDQRCADEPEPRCPARHQARAVHQVAKDQPVPPTTQRGPRRNVQSLIAASVYATVPSDGPATAVAQRDDPEHADDADEDGRALDQTRGHIAKRQLLVLWLRIGRITTAVPMFATISSSSSRAASKTRLSCPAPAM